jgi:hypothetical protein
MDAYREVCPLRSFFPNPMHFPASDMSFSPGIGEFGNSGGIHFGV